MTKIIRKRNKFKCDLCKSTFRFESEDVKEKVYNSTGVIGTIMYHVQFESVLVCYKSQGGMAQCVTERLMNIDGSNRWSAMYGQEPIAWMPLPEPYKVKREE